VAFDSGNAFVARGAGIMLNSGTLIAENTTVRACLARATNPPGHTDGGGIHVGANGRLIMRRCVVADNLTDHYNSPGMPEYGGGLYSIGPSVYLQNCLFLRNGGFTNMTRYGDAIYYGGSGSLVITNCTIANNTSNGIWKASGTATLQNSILWNNGDDLTGTMSVAYCDIQTTDSFWAKGVNGCMSADPLFVDTTYCHLKSSVGYYVGGYFSGGSWNNAPTNVSVSPCINSGNPASAFDLEPEPNGSRVNMGAYGNTEVASKKLFKSAAILMIY
jgi:hypothetical protein